MAKNLLYLGHARQTSVARTTAAGVGSCKREGMVWISAETRLPFARHHGDSLPAWLEGMQGVQTTHIIDATPATWP